MKYVERKDMRNTGFRVMNATPAWVISEDESMNLYKQTEIENYYPEPKLATGPNKRFLVVRYGWYAFSFLLDEHEKRGRLLNEKAVEMCKALLALEGRDEGQLRYNTGLEEVKAFQKRERAKHRAGRTPVTLLPGSTPKGRKGSR